MNSRVIMAIGILLCVAGCAELNVKPSPTADQVMAQQYRARDPHGAMSGGEAGVIAEAYRQQIAKPPQMPQTNNAESRSD
jgi:hypothetical protein